MVNVELLTDVQGAKDVGDVVKVINRFAKPFGEIQSWTFSRDREKRELRVYITLEQSQHHKDLAGRLGGVVQGPEVCFAIPLYNSFEATTPLAPMRAHDDPRPAADDLDKLD